MTYRISQSHDGWRASFEGHGVKISVTKAVNENEAIRNMNALLVKSGLSRFQMVK